MQAFVTALGQSDLLLLFLVILLGSMASRVQIGGVRLGPAGILFTGMAVTAFLREPEHELQLAPELQELGLVLFVYCVGLTGGPGFFRAFRSGGLKLNLTVLGALLLAGVTAILGARLLGADRGLAAGVFAGALTNTPALGAASNVLSGTALAASPVLGYSVTYPFGVLGCLLLLRAFAQRGSEELRREIDKKSASGSATIQSLACEIQNPAFVGHSIGELALRSHYGVIVSRLQRGDEQFVPTKYTVLAAGDVVTLVGPTAALERAVPTFGRLATASLPLRGGPIDMRRILVSRHDLANSTIEELDLVQRYGAQVTRVRRADVDIVPSENFRVELGDRLRVVAPRERLAEIAKFFGDSERALAEVDFVGLALGLCAGLLLARVPIPIFGTHVTLGVAGGPLVVALWLGQRSRIGPLHFVLPFEINSVLRELGLLLFLAGVGVSAGAYVHRILSPEGLGLFLLGVLVTSMTTLLTLVGTRRWAKSAVIEAMGVTAGMQTQPAILASAFELSQKSEDTYVAYAVVYPVAMIAKILVAQLIAMAA